MNYKAYMFMIRRSVDRIKLNIEGYDNNTLGDIALVHVGLELRQIGCIIDEAYDLRQITYNMYKLLKRWYSKYYDKVIHDVIWL